jgi:EAL domain-containing protein (putative c-di-GMP-specific phosphodiesterase class I)
VVKFDMTLIRDINSAPPRQQQMLANLVRMVREMGIKALAEGVETEAEHVVCRDLGFELGQGYYYGRPASAGATARQSNPDHVLV